MKTYYPHRVLFAVGILAFITVFVPRVRAQITYGSLVGNVRDASGAPMPGVSITVTNERTGEQVKQLTNSVGAYAFTTLFPGEYSIHAEISGFRPVDIRGVTLQVNQTARYDLTMQVGEWVRVTAAFGS